MAIFSSSVTKYQRPRGLLRNQLVLNVLHDHIAMLHGISQHLGSGILPCEARKLTLKLGFYAILHSLCQD